MEYRRIRAPEAAGLIARLRTVDPPELALFDARDRSWFDRGHIRGARHLDDRTLGRALRIGSRRRPVIVYADGGEQSRAYATIFARFHFTQVYSVEGTFELLAAALREHYLPSTKPAQITLAG